MQKTASSEKRFSLARAAGLLACALFALAALPTAPAWADDAEDEVCGYAYLDPIDDAPGMYALVLQEEPRKEVPGFVDLGEIRQRSGWMNTTSPNSLSRGKIREATTRGTIRPLDMTGWFSGLQNLEKVDLKGIDVSEVTALDRLFYDCYALREVDISTWETSNVQSMRWTFHNCTSLESVEFFTALNVDGLVSLNNTFSGCESLAKADLSSMSMPNVKSLICVFEDCTALEQVALPHEGLSNVSDLPHLFAGCTSLEQVDFGSLDASQAQAQGTSYGGLDPLLGCCALRSITLSPRFGKPDALEDAFDGGVRWKPDGDDSACATPDEMVAYAAGKSDAEGAESVSFSIQLTGESIVALERNQGGTLAIRAGWRELEEGERFLGVVKSSGLPWESRRQQYSSATFETEVAPASTARWFSGFGNLVDIANMENLNTSNVADMSYMFGREAQWTHREGFISGYVGCHSLVMLDLSHLDTRQATDMSYMFSGATALAALDLSSFNCANVTSMSHMFDMTTMGSYVLNPSDAGSYYGEYRSSLKTLRLPASLGTSNVTDMTGLFQNCSSLLSLDMPAIDTSSVVGADALFFGCESLTSLDVSRMNTSSMRSMSDMFGCCRKLQELDISTFDVPSAIDMGYLIWGCSSLTEFSFDCRNTGNVVWASHLFAHCDALESLTIGDVDLSNVQEAESPFRREASECPSLETVTVEAGAKFAPSVFPAGMWQDEGGAVYRANRVPSGVEERRVFTRVEERPRSYAVLTSAGELRLSSDPLVADVDAGDVAWSVSDEGYSSAEDVPWHDRRLDVKSVVISDLDEPESLSYWFSGCENLRSFDLESMSAAITVVRMNEMFSGCSSLCEVDLSGISANALSGTTSNSLNRLFDGCSQLRSVKFPDKFNVYSASAMFRNCISLTDIDWGDAVNSPSDCSEMFRNCTSLASLDLLQFNTRNTTSLKRMFHGCRALASVTLGADFTFRGSSVARLPGSEFPSGAWQAFGGDGQSIVESEDAEKGITRVYASDSIPNLKAATYKRVADETAEGLVVESLRGDTVAGTAKYTVDTTFVKEGDAVEAVNDYRLDDSYAADSFVVGDAAKASSVKLTNTTVTKQTVGSVYSKKVSLIEIGPQVSRIKAKAFENAPNVKSITVRSDKLTTKGSVYNCLFKSRVMKVHYDLTTTYTKYLKVKGAFKKWSGKKFK